jgi:teichuronic acid biosynthesis glycosyltransferase TuaG
MPRVSIIIPAFNAQAYLGETLASVNAQTYDDWEVVVADDCSTDGTVETAAAFGGRVTVLRGASNEGPASARNRAVSASSGELLSLLDADDLWAPNYLDRTVRLYDESRARGVRVGIVACDARILAPGGFLPQTYMEFMGFPPEVSLTQMLVSNPIYVGAMLPRALVDEAGGFCPELFGTEDYDLWLRILELGYRVVATREALTVYRLRSTSVSSDPARMARSLQLTYRRALERGMLTRNQRRIAGRQLRLQRALEQVGLIISERRGGGSALTRLAQNVPLFLRVAVENPDRWVSTARILAGRGSPLSQVVK